MLTCQQTCYWLHNFGHAVSPVWFVCFTHPISFRFLSYQVRQINVVIYILSSLTIFTRNCRVLAVWKVWCPSTELGAVETWVNFWYWFQSSITITIKLTWWFNIIYIISNFVCIVWGVLANGANENVGRTIKTQLLVGDCKQSGCDWLYEKGCAGFHDTQHQRNKKLWSIYSVIR